MESHYSALADVLQKVMERVPAADREEFLRTFRKAAGTPADSGETAEQRAVRECEMLAVALKSILDQSQASLKTRSPVVAIACLHNTVQMCKDVMGLVVQRRAERMTNKGG